MLMQKEWLVVIAIIGGAAAAAFGSSRRNASFSAATNPPAREALSDNQRGAGPPMLPYEIAQFWAAAGDDDITLEGEQSQLSAWDHPEYSASAPHAGPGVAADVVPIGKVSKASGINGRSVAELNAAPAALRGERVRVRAVVVKSTPAVLGRTFVHVRDGSGAAADGTHDLTVTTQEQPVVGSEVLLEGVLEFDKDFGSGYRYKVLLSDATLIVE